MASIKMIPLNGEGTNEVVDVVKEYNWAVSNTIIAREEVPTIKIREYQQDVTSIKQGIRFWANQGRALLAGKTVDPYEKLYSASAVEWGNDYIFPFYDQYHHDISNAWGENKGTVSEYVNTAFNMASNLSKLFFPSAGIESAKSWEGTTKANYAFTFQLLNTMGTLKDIEKNQALIVSLIRNNLVDKVNFLVMRPPALCEITIPGIRGRTIGVMSPIKISNIGQINRIDGQNVPDAYQIQIGIQELLTESRQIYNGKIGQVVARIDPVDVAIEDAFEELDQGFEDIYTDIYSDME